MELKKLIVVTLSTVVWFMVAAAFGTFLALVVVMSLIMGPTG
jgi:hypothetical protein